MSVTRIYCVADGEKERLIRASSNAQALRYVARKTFVVQVATQDDLEKNLTAGVKVEDASLEPIEE